MSFTSAVAGELVHKRAVEEVLVTDSDRLQDVFWVAARFPNGHGLYGDRCDRDRHDFISLLEMVRQGPGALVAHRYLGVPLDYRFVLRDIELRLADGFSAMPRRDAGSDVVMTVTATDRVYRNDVLSRWRCSVSLAMDGTMIAGGALAVTAMADPVYQKLRALGASDVPARLQPDASRSDRSSPLRVGRGAEGNVVITPLHELSDGRVRAELVVDLGHPTFFDHELDHLPGMLLMEAARQTTIAGTAMRHGIDPRKLHLVAVGGKFHRFGELDVPLTYDATIGPLTRRSSGAIVEATVELHHGGHSVGTIATVLAATQPIAAGAAHARPRVQEPEPAGI